MNVAIIIVFIVILVALTLGGVWYNRKVNRELHARRIWEKIQADMDRERSNVRDIKPAIPPATRSYEKPNVIRDTAAGSGARRLRDEDITSTPAVWPTYLPGSYGYPTDDGGLTDDRGSTTHHSDPAPSSDPGYSGGGYSSGGHSDGGSSSGGYSGGSDSSSSSDSGGSSGGSDSGGF